MANAPTGRPATEDLPKSDSAARGVAVWMVIAGAFGAVFLGTLTAWLVRDQLHIGCGVGPPGSEGAGSWTCRDGIGYLWVAVTLGGMTVAVTIVGGFIAGRIRNERVARTALVVLAGTSLWWVLAWTWHGSSELVMSVPPGTQSIDYWIASVLPAAIVCGTGILAAIVGLVFRGAGARILLSAGAIAVLAGTVLQPGLAISTLPAAGLLAAAAVRVPRRR